MIPKGNLLFVECAADLEDLIAQPRKARAFYKARRAARDAWQAVADGNGDIAAAKRLDRASENAYREWDEALKR